MNQCANAKCSNRLPVGASRRTVYCSVACRRAVEHSLRRKATTFKHITAELLAEGEETVRRRLADDPDYREQLIVLAETHLKPPDGREEVRIDPEVLLLLIVPDRSFSVIGHDNPLPSSADIDYAEATGDWVPMVEAAYKSMTWQRAHRFKPDLREFPQLERISGE